MRERGGGKDGKGGREGGEKKGGLRGEGSRCSFSRDTHVVNERSDSAGVLRLDLKSAKI